MLLCEVFIVFTLVTTVTWVWCGRFWSLDTLSLAMFFPALFAPWFLEDPGFLWQVIGQNISYLPIHLVIGGFSAISVLLCVVLVNLATGMGKLVDNPREKAKGIPDMLPGFFRAAGEEIGWRCYLLPCLLQEHPLWMGLLLSGVVWGLWHVPIMLLLTHRLQVKSRWTTVAVQFTHCLLATVPYSWLAMKTGFSMWAPTMMHFTWNRLNPVVTGSIYTQTAGKLKGPMWLVNAEGLAGCLAMIPIVIAFCYHHQTQLFVRWN